MKASTEVPSAMEALTGLSSTEAFVESSVEAFMKGLKDSKGFAEVTPSGASTKSSTEACMEVTPTKASTELPWK